MNNRERSTACQSLMMTMMMKVRLGKCIKKNGHNALTITVRGCKRETSTKNGVNGVRYNNSNSNSSAAAVQQRKRKNTNTRRKQRTDWVMKPSKTLNKTGGG